MTQRQNGPPPVSSLYVAGEQITPITSIHTLSPKYVTSLGKAAARPNLVHPDIYLGLQMAGVGELLLLPDSFTDSGQFDSAHIVQIPKLRKTREQSAEHHVKFGQLILADAASVPVQEYVAHKSMPVEKSVREAAINRHVRANANAVGANAYQPIGFIREKNGNAALLTRFSAATLTLDNVLWNKRYQAANSKEIVEDALAKAATSLATLHAMRVTHGDAQPKNIAWDNTNNRPWFVDLEEAQSHPRNGDRTLFEDEAEGDLLTFMLFQPTKKSPDQFDLVASTYIDAYQEKTGERSPVTKNTIMRMRNKELRPLPIIKT